MKPMPESKITDAAVARGVILSALRISLRAEGAREQAADAILTALAAAGLKVVAREPTEEMQAVEESFLCRVYDNGDIWRAMFDAAPPLEAPDRALQPTGEA